MGIAYYNLVLVTKYKLRILWREFACNVRETLEGKLAVVVIVAGPFLVKSMLVSSALRQANLNEHAAWVVLWTAHLAMMAALVLGVVSRTARSLIVDRREDPLAQYGHARQGLAAFHMWGEVVGAITLWLSLFFYLLYGPLVSRLSAQPVMGTLLHVIGHIVISLALGAVAYRLTLRALELRPALGRRLFWMTGTPAVFAFVAIAGAPQLFLDFAPQGIGELRSVFDRAGPFYAPVAALLGSPVRPGPLLGWLVGVGAAGAIATGAASPLIRSPSTLVLGEIQGPVSRRFKSIFGRQRHLPTKRVVHGARMFFLKDVLLDRIRSPQSFIRRQTAFLGTASLAPVLAWGLQREGLIGEFEAEALILSLVILLVSAAAYFRGLGALGSEGPALALLRPVVRPADLLGYKTLSAMSSVVPAGLLCGGVAGALAKALDLRPGPVVASGTAGLTAVLLATFAVSLGFLFPDFKRRNPLVPGASLTGRIVFLSVAIYGAGVTAGLRWLTQSEVLPSTAFVPGLITTGGVGTALTGTVIILVLQLFTLLLSAEIAYRDLFQASLWGFGAVIYGMFIRTLRLELLGLDITVSDLGVVPDSLAALLMDPAPTVALGYDALSFLSIHSVLWIGIVYAYLRFECRVTSRRALAVPLTGWTTISLAQLGLHAFTARILG